VKTWQNTVLSIDVDGVLRGQGADPGIIRTRSPRLAAVAEQALESSRHLIQPEAHVQELKVSHFNHDLIKFQGGKTLRGQVVLEHLIGVNSIVVVICTVGRGIEEYASKVMEDDIVLGLAIDGVGSAAVEDLANRICRQIELDAGKKGLETTIPLSPGMIGWDVEDGQPVLFSLINPSNIGVTLDQHFVMDPRKSLSMIIGIGEQVNSKNKVCDYCAMSENCRYQQNAETILA